MVSPNHDIAKEVDLLCQDHHLIWYRQIVDSGQCISRCTFVPEVMRDPLLDLAHNQNGHNGSRHAYMALKRIYYWPGMMSEVFKHCKWCKECMLQNQGNTSAEFEHFKTPEVQMQLICMDLVGSIYHVTSRGNRFILTCIDMLTGYTVAVPIKDKLASQCVMLTELTFTALLEAAQES